MRSILENVPCVLEKNVYSVALGGNVLNISFKSIRSSVSFKAIISLLIFCLDDLSIAESGDKSPLLLLYCSQWVSLSLLLIVLYICVLQVVGINVYNC